MRLTWTGLYDTGSFEPHALNFTPYSLQSPWQTALLREVFEG